jgi:serine/threonine-protein kinase
MSESTGPIHTVLENRYRVEGFLRPGRFGDLWRAKRLDDGTPVSVKLLKPESYVDGEAIRRFQREVQVLLGFNHPYLLRVLDHGRTAGGDPFLVLEHKEGRLLADLVASGPLDPDQVEKMGAQIARVLSAAAAKGIVHRGLCPEAILVVGDDDIKVLDFGLALPPDDDDGAPRVTSMGQRLGDPAYMAPEYIQTFASDKRTDLYALGILLYELLTGDPPFTGKPFLVLDAHASTVPDPPSSKVPDAGVPAWLDAVVLALLEKDPAARPDATAVARAMVAKTWPPPP